MDKSEKAMASLRNALDLIDALVSVLDENDIESSWAAAEYAAIEIDYRTLLPIDDARHFVSEEEIECLKQFFLP